MSEGPRILIVEDQRIVAADLEATLERLGYAVVGTASTGEDAVRQAEVSRPALALMDIRLRGGMDGIEVASVLGERFDIPVVYLTAYADEETIQRARATSPFGYLVKPFNERELRGAIEVALYKHAQERRLRARELRLARQQARRRAAEESTARVRLLAEASGLLGSSLDYEQTLERVVHLAVPRLADWCAIDLVEDDGVRRIALAHEDPDRAERARELGGEAAEPASPVELGEVLRTGTARLMPRVSAALLEEARLSDAQRAVLRELGLRSLMIVPMTARGRVLGALTCALAGGERRYDASDVALAGELADRAAAAIDNARLYRDAVAANRIKTDFLAVMSHELRTPLNAVIGYADLLDMEVPGPLVEAQREYVGRIAASARHLLQLIEEILTFSRLESRSERPEPEPAELGALMREVGDMLRPLAERKGLSFHVRLPEPGAAAEIDVRKVRQILINLVDNAIKFTERGGVELAGERSGGEVVFRVRDTGIGIPAWHRRQLFEPFWQGEQGTTRRGTGTGLGLAVVDQLTRLLGGRVAVKSAPGGGTLFTVHLPAGAGTAAET
jgi:signal transduction histidine kinase/DNA-binding NarL/FixJ family response regulator